MAAHAIQDTGSTATSGRATTTARSEPRLLPTLVWLPCVRRLPATRRLARSDPHPFRETVEDGSHGPRRRRWPRAPRAAVRNGGRPESRGGGRSGRAPGPLSLSLASRWVRVGAGRVDEQVVHVRVMAAVRAGSTGRRTNPASLEVGAKRFVIAAPDSQPPPDDRIGGFELGPEERGVDLARSVRGADVDPGVLVDFAPRRSGCGSSPSRWTISARWTNAAVVDEQRAALARSDVLRLVEAQRPRGLPKAAERRPR